MKQGTVRSTLAPEISPEQLRRELGNYPTGVTVITTLGDQREQVGVTANSFASLSLDPPLITWALDLKAGSLEHFSKAELFAVNFLSDEQGEIAMRFAKRSVDKFANTNLLSRPKAKQLGLPKHCPPILESSAGWLLCKNEKAMDLGDHRLFVGRVLQIEGDTKQEQLEPIVFHRGNLRGLGLTRELERSADLTTNQFTNDYLAYLLAKASHAVSEEFHQVVLEYGLPIAQWRVLASLSPDVCLSVGELADRVLSKQPTLTKLLDRMQAEGLVKRMTATDDARKTEVRLTAKGRAKVKILLSKSKLHEERLAKVIGSVQLRQLKSDLRAVIARNG